RSVMRMEMGMRMRMNLALISSFFAHFNLGSAAPRLFPTCPYLSLVHYMIVFSVFFSLNFLQHYKMTVYVCLSQPVYVYDCLCVCTERLEEELNSKRDDDDDEDDSKGASWSLKQIEKNKIS